jgi:putative transposase
LGRSRGGFGTKIHGVVNPLGHPVVLKLTGSEAADSPQLPALIEGLTPEAVLADKGYDSDANREAIRRQGAEPCIPARKNRTEPIAYDRHLYGERNVVERFFARIKQFRRVATRYDKKAANFLGFVWVASVAIMLA